MSVAVEWRTVLCDKDGNYISLLSTVAQNPELQVHINRPAMYSFEVPSDDPRVNIVFDDDDHPYLTAKKKRIVKMFRKTTGGVYAPGNWELKFAGRVWSLEDSGDGDQCVTQVTCFDDLKMLEKRVVRDALGRADRHVQYWDTPGSQIVRELIERTRDFVGPIFIDVGGTWVDTAEQSLAWDQQYISAAVQQIFDTATCELDVDYLNTFDGVFIRLGAKGRIGTDRTATVTFSYAAAPYTATEFRRTESLDTMANDVTLWGKKVRGKVAHAEDAASQDEHGVFESVEVVDVGTQSLLDDLADEALQLRKDPRDLVTVLPTPEGDLLPWDHWNLGDTVTVEAADTPFPVTRDTVDGAQRIYGFTVAQDTDYGEFVKDLVVSPDGA